MIGTYNGDPPSWINPFWWYQHNVYNSTHAWDYHWLFYNDYQFYPLGTPINEYGLLTAWSTIVLMPIVHDVIHVYNLLMYMSFIFTGYGTFLLARFLTKNYYASLIAAMMFTFGIYHIFHGSGHLSYTETQFIPFAILYMIKSIDSKKIKNPIIGGIFLFLVLSSSLYLGFFMVIFLIGFLLYLTIIRINLKAFLRLGLIVVIGFSLTFPIYYENYLVAGTPQKNTFHEFVDLSNDLANFFLPSPIHTIYHTLGYPLGQSIGSWETFHFLGYTALFLTIVALIKVNRNEKLLWLITGLIIGIISLGPFLKIYGNYTGIPLPYYFLYKLPYFDIFRALGRGGLFVTLSVSIFCAYGINEISKIKSISKNKKFLIIGIIGVLVFVELLTSPIVTDNITIPEIYYKIAKDPNFSVVLESPIGRYSENNRYHLETNHLTVFYQTIHGKAIYSGLIPRIPEEHERYVQTYFLNQFIWHQPQDDIIKQNLSEVGISLFNHFNIGYVIVRNSMERTLPQTEEFVKTVWFPKTKSLLYDIFSRPPDYSDNDLFAYKVPKPTSKIPFLALDQDWSPFLNFYRTFANQGTIVIGDTASQSQEKQLQITFVSPIKNKIHFVFNNTEIFQADLDPMITYSVHVNLKLNPGENNLLINSEKTATSLIPVMPYLSTLSSLDVNVGLAVNSIKLDSFSSSGNFIKKLDNDPFAAKLLIYSKIEDIYLKTIARGATANELDVFSNRLSDNPDYPLAEILKNGPEYKQLHLEN